MNIKTIRLIARFFFFVAMPCLKLAAQENILQYVNPFIGTAKSNVYTKWGNEGGTYPGAAAPWGFMQLSPETRNSGYDYTDSAIHFFTCIQHHSGFPGGSAGRLRIMPAPAAYRKAQSLHFSHADEAASPGYYKVFFRKEHILAEATATVHGGMFRISFPANTQPVIFISDAGEWPGTESGDRHGLNTVFRFSLQPKDTVKWQDGYLLRFNKPSGKSKTVLTIRLSVSEVSISGAEDNLAQELSGDFEKTLVITQTAWKKQLAVVEVGDASFADKEVFYTALYHSLLLPWIISDANGLYRGVDGKIYKTTGRNAYGGFSPWDTFRSLHPLLSFLYPDVQRDMLLSMLAIYQQGGYLPVESMTGNHAIPIIVDSYLKGIHPADSLLLYKAMKKSIVDGPYLQKDFALYADGFIPYPYTESVTKTVEYTYDDWALAQYADKVMRDDSLSSFLMKRSRNYLQLFNQEELCLLPKKDSTSYPNMANAGYKEGDQWVYTLFLPHYQRSLINLKGGDDNFIKQADEALQDKRLVFDNETMFHVPYLFNSTLYPYKTQAWVQAIRSRFSSTPGGLPGNDDLGSTSAWYVWSALGIFPVCPGSTEYAVGTPLFKNVVLHLPSGKELTITASNLSANSFFVRSVSLNGQAYKSKWIEHNILNNGGALQFEMDSSPVLQQQPGYMKGDTDGDLNWTATSVAATKSNVLAGEGFWVRYTLQNGKAMGTAIVKLYIDDSIELGKNCLLKPGEIKADSIFCRLYAYGKHSVRLLQQPVMHITITGDMPNADAFNISALHASPLVKKGGYVQLSYQVQNISSANKKLVLPVKENSKVLLSDTIQLAPGNKTTVYHSFPAKVTGWRDFAVMNETVKSKVYERAEDALVLLFDTVNTSKGTLYDNSGFGYNGYTASFENYIQLPHCPGLDSNGTALTIMAWVYDTITMQSSIDLIAKGDNHVLQLSNHKQLGFFAGGWGRGDCTVPLPENWVEHWHHIAGVCTGRELQVYIDGRLTGTTHLEEVINLNVPARWTIGSNEEFPLDRTFKGRMRDVRIYMQALDAVSIQHIYESGKLTR
ncbi:GH92 family glycosyl hydrolase [Parafilimonas sp.]|uniref:GH92 family glycosyl hydrolase n=1 Tax=Parafilimonas sp. TaxID=1969739 RepID=UPI0039E2F104